MTRTPNPDPSKLGASGGGLSAAAALAPDGDCHRDRDQVVLKRGFDLPSRCFVCGGPPEGDLLIQHLRVPSKNPFATSTWGGKSDAGLIYFLIVFPLQASWAIGHFVAEMSRSKNRPLRFALCGVHRRRRKWMRSAAWFFGIVGPLIIVARLMWRQTPEQADTWLYVIFGLGGFIGGVLFCTVAGLIGSAIAGPSLVKEDAEHFWLDGAGKPFLEELAPKS